MKIKINEQETYEIKFDEEISLNELQVLVEKLKVLSEIPQPISKPISKPKETNNIKPKEKENYKGVKCISCGSKRLYKKGFTAGGLRRLFCKNCKVTFTAIKQNGLSKIVPEERIRRKGMKWKDRNVVLKALKIHYFGNKADKLKFEKEQDTTWNNTMKAFGNLKARFNIRPQEIGLKEFPMHKGINQLQKSQEQPVEQQPAVENEAPNPDPFKIPTPQPPLELKKEEETNEDEDENGDKPKWWNRKQ